MLIIDFTVMIGLNPTIQKDRYGFVWFGTISGLNRYDGHSFKVYKNISADSTTIPFNNVQRIYEDHKGNLWILSQDNLITVFDPQKDQFYRDYDLFSGENGIPSQNISELAVDPDSNLWVTTNQFGIYRVMSETGNVHLIRSVEGESSSLSSHNITDIIVRDDFTVLIVNAFGVVEILDSKTGRVKDQYQPKALASLENADYFSLFSDSDGDFWIYSEQIMPMRWNFF